MRINIGLNYKRALTTIAILLMGFVAGGIVMLIGGYNPLVVYGKMVEGVFGNIKYISYTIIRATPIIITGLSVAFANRCGLFNIGAEGQYIAGALCATLVGACLSLGAVHPVAALLAAALAGGMVGAIIGALKARFGINEVISGIMLNWIVLYFNNHVVRLGWFEASANISRSIQPSAEIGLFSAWRASPDGVAALSENEALAELFKTPLNYGFLLAILFAVAVWFLLNKTVAGYRIKAVGFNRFAAEYAGINVPRNYVLAMFAAGALAGLAGGVQVCGVAKNVSVLAFSEGYGFDGIVVALIANSSPFGCIFSGLFFAALKYGGSKIQQAPLSAPSEIINIIIGIIVLFAAAPSLFKELNKRWERIKGGLSHDK